MPITDDQTYMPPTDEHYIGRKRARITVAVRLLPDGRRLQVDLPALRGMHRLYVLTPSVPSVSGWADPGWRLSEVWNFASLAGAVNALRTWDGTGRPMGQDENGNWEVGIGFPPIGRDT